jgi:tetratricopeptide (TPR) repeat protein
MFYDNRAYLWRKLENYSNAAEDYKIILEYYPDNIKALINRAFCYAKIDMFEEAIEDYSAVLSIEPVNAHALYNRAISFDKLGRINEVNILLFILFMFRLYLISQRLLNLSQ